MRTWSTLAVLAVAVLAGCLGNGDEPKDEPEPPLPDPATDRTVAHGTDGRLIPLDDVDVDVPVFTQRYVGERSAGEPTIAVTPEGAIYPSIDFDVAGGALASTVIYASEDEGVTWEARDPTTGGLVNVHQTSLDPYVYADPTTGRMFSMDLTLACSILSWTDDVGATWTSNPVACGVPVNDHQTLFAGPATVQPTTLYENVLYYCNNQVFEATCAHSLDGGLSWTNGAPVFLGVEPGVDEGDPQGVCGGLHGHGHASFVTGRAYVPKGHCGQAWVSMSDDNGLTWNAVLVDNTVGFDGHEAIVSTDSAGNAYYFFLDDDTLPRLSVSTDGGDTWGPPMAVGRPGVTAAKFPSIVAGEEGRVAFLYLGTDVEGGWDAEPEDMEEATWNAHVGFVFDALSDDPTVISTTANPIDDPLRRGPCSGRCFGDSGGMYDFLDIDIKPDDGQVWVALVDLCNDACAGPDGRPGDEQISRGAVGVQTGGMRLGAQVPG